MIMQKNNSVLKLLLILATFIPQLPPIFNRSEVHINVIFFFLSILFILLLKPKIKKNQIVYLSLYYFTSQLLLIASYTLGPNPFNDTSDLPSLFRPIMLFTFTMLFLTCLTDFKSIYCSILKITKIIVVSVFIYSILEVFFLSNVGNTLFFLYRMEDKSNIDGVAVSFFTLPYYSSYIMLLLFPILLSNHNKNSNIRSLSLILICISNIVLTQSKMGIFLVFGVIFIYYFISSKLFIKILICFIFIFTAVLLFFFLNDFISFLYYEYGGNFAKTLYLILNDFEHAYNLTERLNDIIHTYDLIKPNNFLFGLGLGKGLTIEIWIASLMYRIGFLGLIFFITFFVVTSILLYRKISPNEIHIDFYYNELVKLVFIWSSTIFISQLSGLMMEASKGAIFSSLMFALSAKCLFDKGSHKELLINCNDNENNYEK